MIKKPDKGMTIIVMVVTRLTVGLILIFGIYIMLHGHLTPGGGFAGGVIVALSFIHMVLAFGKETALKKVSKSIASYFEGIGAIIFLSVGLIGLFGGYFFVNVLHHPDQEKYLLFSSGSILLSNLAICIEVGAGLFSVFLALVLFKGDTGDKK